MVRAADGSIVKVWAAQSFDESTDANIERQQRLGTRKKPLRQTINGHSGTATFEVDGFDIHDMQDAMIEAYEAGEPEVKFEFYRRIYVPKIRASRNYRYPGVVFSTSESSPGQDDPTTVTINWQSETREVVGS